MFYRFYLYLICVLFVQQSLWAVTRADQVSLVKNGRSTATIVISSAASEAEQYAANELQKYIEKMSSAKLPLQTDAETAPGNLIFVGNSQSDFLKKNNIVIADALGEQDFVIRTVGNKLLLVGGGDWGTVYAVYAFLETLGCRWFMPGPLGEVVPRENTIAIASINKVERPWFKYRRLLYFGGGEAEVKWQLQTKSSNFISAHGLKGYEGFGGHAYESLLPPQEYFEKHPEYFALKGGKRTTHQICLSHPEVEHIVSEKAKAFFRSHPEKYFLSFSLSPNDYADFCECSGCLALGPTITDRVMDFNNRVARAVAKDYPDRLINCYAYAEYFEPPQAITKMEDNVAIIICRIGDDGIYNQPITADNRFSRRSKAVLERWAEITSHLGFYDYWAGHYEWLGPWLTVKTLAVDVPFYRNLRNQEGRDIVDAMVPQVHPHWGTQGLNVYVLAKSSWDAYVNVDSLVEDYYARFYGSAAGAVKRYYQIANDAIAAKAEYFWGSDELVRDVYTSEVMARLRQALQEARAAAKTAISRERIALLEQGLEYVEHERQFRLLMDGGSLLPAVGAGEATLDYIHHLPKDQVLQTAPAVDHINTLLGQARRGVQRFTEKLGAFGITVSEEDLKASRKYIEDWYVIGPFDNPKEEGFDRIFPPEEEIQLDRTYSGSHNQTVSWHTIHSGFPYVNLDRLFSPNDSTVAYALSRIYSPSSRQGFLGLGSDDWLKIWVNGTEVLSQKVFRESRPFQEIIPIELQQGWNTLLLKVTERIGGWGFHVCLMDSTTRNFTDLKFEP